MCPKSFEEEKRECKLKECPNCQASRGVGASVSNIAGTQVAKCHFGSKIQKFGPNLEDRPLKIKNFEVSRVESR